MQGDRKLHGSEFWEEAPACPSGKGRALGNEHSVMRSGVQLGPGSTFYPLN